ncbi:hypothetical protein GCM10020254_75660 [Streptomyces goshikiensis]
MEAEERTVEEVVAALGEAGILQGVRFWHGSVRTAVLESLADDDVSLLRRRAARLLYEAGAAPVAVAAQLLGLGTALPEEDWAPGVLSDAAHTALASQRVGFAVRCLRLAELCSRDQRERLQLRASMAKFIWRVNPSAWARELRPLNAASQQGSLPVTESLRLVGDLLWNGWIDDAATAIQHALEGMPGNPDAALTAELRSVRLVLASTYPTLLDRLDSAFGPALESAESPELTAGDGVMAAMGALQGVLSAGPVRPADEELTERAERILSGTRLTEETHVTVRACLLALLYADRLGAATLWADRLLEEAAERDAPGWTAVMQAMRAHMALRRGELVQTRRLAEEAMEQLPPHGWGVGIGIPLAALIEARTAMGDHEAAAALVDHPVPEQMLLTRYGLHYVYARGRHQLATGRHHAALTDFMTCGRLMREWDMDRAGVAPWRVGVAEASLALGNRGRGGAVRPRAARRGRRTAGAGPGPAGTGGRPAAGRAARAAGAGRDPAPGRGRLPRAGPRPDRPRGRLRAARGHGPGQDLHPPGVADRRGLRVPGPLPAPPGRPAPAELAAAAGRGAGAELRGTGARAGGGVHTDGRRAPGGGAGRARVYEPGDRGQAVHHRQYRGAASDPGLPEDQHISSSRPAGQLGHRCRTHCLIPPPRPGPRPGRGCSR